MQHRGGEDRAGQFWPLGLDPTVSRGARASPAPPALVGSFGSAGEDLRHHGTCAPVAIAGSAACAIAMGDGWTYGEGASGTSVWEGRVVWPTMGPVGHGAVADE
jgi:hypothetical protein